MSSTMAMKTNNWRQTNEYKAMTRPLCRLIMERPKEFTTPQFYAALQYTEDYDIKHKDRLANLLIHKIIERCIQADMLKTGKETNEFPEI